MYVLLVDLCNFPESVAKHSRTKLTARSPSALLTYTLMANESSNSLYCFSPFLGFLFFSFGKT